MALKIVAFSNENLPFLSCHGQTQVKSKAPLGRITTIVGTLFQSVAILPVLSSVGWRC
jgi:hypothetical protein